MSVAKTFDGYWSATQDRGRQLDGSSNVPGMMHFTGSQDRPPLERPIDLEQSNTVVVVERLPAVEAAKRALAHRIHLGALGWRAPSAVGIMHMGGRMLPSNDPLSSADIFISGFDPLTLPVPARREQSNPYNIGIMVDFVVHVHTQLSSGESILRLGGYAAAPVKATGSILDKSKLKDDLVVWSGLVFNEDFTAEEQHAEMQTGRLQHLLNKLDGYRMLGPNWNGYGGLPPSPEAIEQCSSYLRSLGSLAIWPDTMVGANGEVGLYWDTPEVSVEIGFLERDHFGFLVNFKDGLVEEDEGVPLSNEVPLLLKAISRFRED